MIRPSTRLLTVAAMVVLLAIVSACGDTDDLDEEVGTAAEEAESLADELEDGTVTDELSEDEVAETVESSADALREAVGDDELTLLFEALDLVGFDDIAEAERFTFFAPNDGAFAAVDGDLLAELLADSDALTGLLRNHLLDDVVLAADIPADGTVTTTGGLELTFDLSGDRPTVNGIAIVRTDVMVDDRGVVHVIDGLLLES